MQDEGFSPLDDAGYVYCPNLYRMCIDPELALLLHNEFEECGGKVTDAFLATRRALVGLIGAGIKIMNLDVASSLEMHDTEKWIHIAGQPVQPGFA